MNKSQFLKLLGPKTQRPNLNSKIIKQINSKKYVLEKVSYLVEKNERVNSYFFLPKKKRKFPVVICHHQHASRYNLAKSEIAGIRGNKNLSYAKEIAERGIATLAIDAIGFEERNKLGKNWWGVEYFEMASRIINGKTLLEKTLSDLSAAIDYIVSRPEVDEKRIGFIGHSYGGRMACILPAYDKRIKVSVANCYARLLKNSLDIKKNTRIPMELVVPNILKFGDFSDFLKLSNNCNVLLSVSKKDKWSQDAMEIYKKTKKFFKKKNLQLKRWPAGHSFSKKMRLYSYKYIEKFI